MRVRDHYIELLMKSLSFSLWHEPPHLFAQSSAGKILTRSLLKGIDFLIAPLGAAIAWRSSVTEEARREGKFWPSLAHTMIGTYRLENIRTSMETVLQENIPGDFIETGVWRGGACIFMRGILTAYGEQSRKVYVADSFVGLPPPDSQRYPADAGDTHYQYFQLAISREQVEENFKKYDLLDDQVEFVEGFFEDTLHKIDNNAFAMIRLDGDMYGSTIVALEALYPKLSKGGFCIIGL